MTASDRLALYVLQHREATKQFQEILKPNYKTVDLAEVEIVDVDEPRSNNTKLFQVCDRRRRETFPCNTVARRSSLLHFMITGVGTQNAEMKLLKTMPFIRTLVFAGSLTEEGMIVRFKNSCQGYPTLS